MKDLTRLVKRFCSTDDIDGVTRNKILNRLDKYDTTALGVAVLQDLDNSELFVLFDAIGCNDLEIPVTDDVTAIYEYTASRVFAKAAPSVSMGD